MQSIQVYKHKIKVCQHTAWSITGNKEDTVSFAIKKEMKNFISKTTNIFQKYLKLETVLKNLRTSNI